jgi:cobyrinic acid a,c-diamide synthase
LPALTVFGCIPRDESLEISSRHLGLVTVEDNPLSTGFVGRLAEMAEECLDLDGLVGLELDDGNISPLPLPSLLLAGDGDKIAVARDAAFCFCYADNLRLLREAGAEIVFFSPLADAGLPPDIAGVYLPGGYPELYAGRLSANVGMKDALMSAIRADMPVYAECGGLIYLSEGMEDAGDFVGAFPVRARMLPKRKALGYRQVQTSAPGIIGATGTVARGHEFHYSETGVMPDGIELTYLVTRQGKELAAEGYCFRNCLASYIHLHFGSNPAIAPAFVDACKAYRAMLQK